MLNFCPLSLGGRVDPKNAAVFPQLAALVLENVERNHGEAHLDRGLFSDLDPITLPIECDVMLSDRRTILQQRVFSGLVGASGAHSRGSYERRRDQQQTVAGPGRGERGGRRTPDEPGGEDGEGPGLSASRGSGAGPMMLSRRLGRTLS
jgi:hypothetical protein